MNIPIGNTGGSSKPPVYDSFICNKTNSNNFASAVLGKFIKDTYFSL